MAGSHINNLPTSTDLAENQGARTPLPELSLNHVSSFETPDWRSWTAHNFQWANS
jgi:hypothetical protein